ncbi:hypothetical protein [Cellulomonas fimi]|uniref:hypothetical protein n=1 Tax=Cellulomonas fimi TaxID=1708 RepID=UPI002358B4A4|nr:hypothetical protein [Cellulomonas fimi]
MVAVDDAVLESVGSGWALTLYVATGGDASALGPGAVGNVLVLASPDGQLYWVGDDVDAVIGPWDGSPQVPVVTGGGTARGRLDLRTGDVTELPRPAGLPADARPLRSSATLWTADHDNGKGSIWTSDGGGPARLVADDLPPYTASTAVVNPGETAALVTTWSVDGAPSRVVDLVAGGSRDLALGLAGTMCELVAWESATTVLSVCGDSSFEARPFSDTTGRPRLVRGDVTGSSAPVVLRDFAVGDLVPVQGVTLPGGRVAATAYAIGPDVLPESCMDRVGVWRDGAMAALDADLPEGYVSLGVSGGRLVITGRDQCLGDETRSTSVVLDLMSGRTTTLPPGPGDGAVMSASAPVVAP